MCIRELSQVLKSTGLTEIGHGLIVWLPTWRPTCISLFRVSQTGASLLPQFIMLQGSSDALHELSFVLQPLLQLLLIGSK
jgi:hypothetical protein